MALLRCTISQLSRIGECWRVSRLGSSWPRELKPRITRTLSAEPKRYRGEEKGNMSSGRRTKQVKGCVDFPVNSKEFISSGEGGMFVQLVVLPHSHADHVCCGGASTSIVMTESFLGDDLSRSPAREYFYFPNSECVHQKRFYLPLYQADMGKRKP